VAQIHPTSVHWIIRFGGNAAETATEVKKTVPEFKNALQTFS